MTKPEDNIISAHFKKWSVPCTTKSFSLQNTFDWYILLMIYNCATQFPEIIKVTQGLQSTEHNLIFVRAYYLMLCAISQLTFQSTLYKHTIKINYFK